ncbi:AhpC/TSA family protein [Bernardetia litoralis DSM 6794]|uniref:AhpC/TSA family protein n=1 Tax=Bernardetia litoralis (strain ATCC 23117 / DSM 6794 / NBRC 15988 / NCIMB 1366 / Fx l1 / Sio-4) TaxID=880071 RepID=I4AHA1_BERLS|nr:TlpA disulfide reductase family protein [Bernardetia litoralis]AFM03336.1 AhpC/TSA family protein [Bernardetia litoralis DSM 6794]
MKKTIYFSFVFFVLLLSILGCDSKKKLPTNEYLVEGNINNLSQDMKLVVSDISTKDIVPLYEVAVKKNDKFKLKGEITEPTPFYLTLIRESDSTFSPSDNLVVFFEPSKMEIQADAGKLSEAKIKGSRSHSHFEMYRKGTIGYEKSMKEFTVKAMNSSQIGDTATYQAAMSEYENQYEEWTTYNKKFIAEDSIDYAVRSFLAVNYMLEEDYLTELETLVQGKKSTWTNQINSFINQVKTISVGQNAPDIATLQNVESESISISRLEKKPTILYFWASFEPKSVSQVQQFGLLETVKMKKEYQFIGISLDSDIDAWKQTIKQLPESHTQLIDTSSDQNAAITYHLTSLPLFVVLDSNQKMIYKANSIEKLNAFLMK